MIDLYNGDCLEVMDELIEKGVKVDAIITDPPYNLSKKNNFTTMGRTGIDFGEWDKNFNLFDWMDLAIKLLDKNGSMIVFNSWLNLGEMVRYAESKGMVCKDCIRWIKSNPMPRNRDRRYVSDFESAFWLTKKGGKWIFNRHSDKYQRPEFHHPVVGGKEKTIHTTQKPVALMEDILKIHTNKNQIVFDPFMGSGTTGVACKNLNRRFIGIELDNKYYEIAKQRIEEAQENEQAIY